LHIGAGRINKYIILSLVAVVAFASSVTFSYGVTQADLDNAKQKTASAADQLAEKKQKEANIAANISALEDKIKTTKAEIAALNKKIVKAEAKMDKLTERFMELENELALQQSDLNARLKEMYLTNDMSMLDVLLNSENIVDLISNMDMIQRIHKQDVKTIKEINKKQEQVEQKKEEITETHDLLVTHYEAQKKKSNDLLSDQQELIAAKAKAGQDTAEAQADYDAAKANQASVAEELSRPVYTAPSNGGGGGGDSSSGGNPDRVTKKTPALGKGIVADAYALCGIPYKWGGTSPSSGFDCSGFVQYVYARNGIIIPRSSGSQNAAGKHIPMSELQPGDIVWKPGHVGIYVGGGQYIHAPQTGDVVRVASNIGRFSHGIRF
jgi:cell wall-associated NlpC family hydrolase